MEMFMIRSDASTVVDATHLDQLSRRWDDRSRRSSAAGWVHHLGEVLFVLSDRYKEQPEVVPYLLGLAARDVALATASSRGIGTARMWKLVTVVTDLVTARQLSKRIPLDDFANDHAISQWGLSLAWVMASSDSESGVTKLLIFPLAFQVVLAQLWGLSWRDVPWYVIKEGFWSAATLWAVDDLRHQIRKAVTQGKESAQRRTEVLGQMRKAAARAQMSEVVWRWIHRDGISALGTVAFEAEARSHFPEISPERAAHLRQISEFAKRETNKLRVRAPIDELSLGARLGRMLAFRDLYERPYDWSSQALPPRARIAPQFLEDLADIESLIIATPGEVTLGIETSPNSVRLWAHGKFEERSLPQTFSLAGSGPIKYLTGTIQCEE
jgi:hypothetical protein